MAQNIQTMIPFQVLSDIDSARNPMQLTRDRLERAAAENQFMNGKMAAIDVSVFPYNLILIDAFPQSYRKLLNEALEISFPETAEYLHPREDIIKMET